MTARKKDDPKAKTADGLENLPPTTPSRKRGGRRKKSENNLEERSFNFHIGKERMSQLHAALTIRYARDLDEDEIMNIVRNVAWAAVIAFQDDTERDNEAIIV